MLAALCGAALLLLCAIFVPLASAERFQTTAYGPPWGGINGGGVTRTGVNLSAAPRIHGVAVDPAVVPLGSRLRIWPNPYRCRRCIWRAFDTGGAIRGRRLDFYVWTGRAAQRAWGRRPVTAYRIRVLARARMRPQAGWSRPPR